MPDLQYLEAKARYLASLHSWACGVGLMLGGHLEHEGC